MIATSSIAKSANAMTSGELNPEEGGISQLTHTLSAHPDRAGFVCWVVYEAQKGGLHAEAMNALRACAESSNEPSMILMSHAYENGLGVRKSDAMATYWVKIAAMHGYPVGQYHYGMALLHGRGVPKDAGQARFWLEQASRAGDRDARDELSALGVHW